MIKSPEYIKARDRAIKYIIFKMRTSYEVFNKLAELNFDENVINSVIYDLKQLEYINDEEYVRKFIESNKKTKKLSKTMIKIKLKNKGIDNELVEKYLIECDAEDFSIIEKILNKKRFSKDLPYEEKNKIIGYCVRKGFSMGDVLKVIKEFE